MATKPLPFVLINGIKWTPALVKETMIRSDKAIKTALLRVYKEQTEEEQFCEQTAENNGIGFNGVDAPFLSSLAKQLTEKGWLSPKQIAHARKKLLKYSRQIYNQIASQRTKAYESFGI